MPRHHSNLTSPSFPSSYLLLSCSPTPVAPSSCLLPPLCCFSLSLSPHPPLSSHNETSPSSLLPSSSLLLAFCLSSFPIFLSRLIVNHHLYASPPLQSYFSILSYLLLSCSPTPVAPPSCLLPTPSCSSRSLSPHPPLSSCNEPSPSSLLPSSSLLLAPYSIIFPSRPSPSPSLLLL